MKEATVAVTEEQLAKLVGAYKTIQEFLAAALSPEKIYRDEILASLSECEDDVQKKDLTKVSSFNDFVR